ncbi:NAD(P)-dependent alcohol dehydrogenase [Neorhizobium petrolearium]|uniref:NAD(P)-dependent alcohol dehydrogenase n=1 Tax=Neorhizobium petrolearium TaxID=515361 RepID=A0ABY8M9Z3_9HYPH|nr:NAD(P)-dependent alcohol dehydrogenase [Neorhizobium petrolearium]MCC2613104.1 NAD(P)-dependent alcohol dehydrogenase [Neorhizobium petrolearium]WGI71338.1 NAD(P)-dependent alcohol dehydrogenase [Neorhizobium petrolearium]
MQQALVLEKKGVLSLREIDLPAEAGPGEVKIEIDTVGVCGSDVHYYTHGAIGPYVLREPMVLGHEAAGTVVDVGSDVRNLKVGDRVCMEPGVPNLSSRASKLGIYNVDPDVRFWATPPIHGVLTPFVIHPAAFTYKLPDNVSFAEGAMVEPFAIGMQAATRARIQPGDVGAVIGAGPIGIMVALAALAGGCARVFISDLSADKLKIAGQYPGLIPVNITKRPFADVIAEETGGWGADVVFEASGSPKAYQGMFDLVRPGGAFVLVGLPVEPAQLDVAGAISKEVCIETVFRYANIFDRALELIASGKVDLKPLITGTFDFKDSIKAFERAAAGLPSDVKLQIKMKE